jgi:hypothetical protein
MILIFVVCSDETITTGYTPNVLVDQRLLSKAIKHATIERRNAASIITFVSRFL